MTSEYTTIEIQSLYNLASARYSFPSSEITYYVQLPLLSKLHQNTGRKRKLPWGFMANSRKVEFKELEATRRM